METKRKPRKRSTSKTAAKVPLRGVEGIDEALEADKEELDRLYPDPGDGMSVDPKTGEIRDDVMDAADRSGSDPETLRLESLQADIFNALWRQALKLGIKDKPETEQSGCRYTLIDLSREIINQTLAIHAGAGRPTVKIVLGDVNRKGKERALIGKFGASGEDPLRHMLTDHAGKDAFIVLANADELLNQPVDQRQESLV